MNENPWFRVDVDASGKFQARQCAGTQALNEGEAVYYVQAVNAEEAVRQARNLYERARVKKERAARVAKGLCRGCPRPAVPGIKYCEVCKERQKGYNKKRYEANKAAAAKGEQPEVFVRDETARVEKAKETSRNRREELRLEVLLLVRRKWNELPTIKVFGEWLAEEVASAVAGKDSQEATKEEIERAVLEVADAIRARQLAEARASKGKH